jgi:putative ABC transport system permease protein
MTFRVLDFPDLSVDGTFPLGAAVAAVLITTGVNPHLATLAALASGLLAGFTTGLLNTKLRISALLSGILVMVALYSINLRIMGRPNISLIREVTIFDWASNFLGLSGLSLSIVVAGVAALVVFLMLNWFLRTDIGLALRATGDNEQMVRGLGVDTDKTVLLGCALGNGLVALAGALVAQNQGNADINMGSGMIVMGLASVIIGEGIFRPKGITWVLVACFGGAFVYRLFMTLALYTTFLRASDLKLITAALVIIALAIPYLRKRARHEWIPPATRW